MLMTRCGRRDFWASVDKSEGAVVRLSPLEDRLRHDNWGTLSIGPLTEAMIDRFIARMDRGAPAALQRAERLE